MNVVPAPPASKGYDSLELSSWVPGLMPIRGMPAASITSLTACVLNGVASLSVATIPSPANLRAQSTSLFGSPCESQISRFMQWVPMPPRLLNASMDALRPTESSFNERTGDSTTVRMPTLYFGLEASHAGRDGSRLFAPCAAPLPELVPELLFLSLLQAVIPTVRAHTTSRIFIAFMGMCRLLLFWLNIAHDTVAGGALHPARGRSPPGTT